VQDLCETLIKVEVEKRNITNISVNGIELQNLYKKRLMQLFYIDVMPPIDRCILVSQIDRDKIFKQGYYFEEYFWLNRISALMFGVTHLILILFIYFFGSILSSKQQLEVSLVFLYWLAVEIIVSNSTVAFLKYCFLTRHAQSLLNRSILWMLHALKKEYKNDDKAFINPALTIKGENVESGIPSWFDFDASKLFFVSSNLVLQSSVVSPEERAVLSFKTIWPKQNYSIFGLDSTSPSDTFVVKKRIKKIMKVPPAQWLHNINNNYLNIVSNVWFSLKLSLVSSSIFSQDIIIDIFTCCLLFFILWIHYILYISETSIAVFAPFGCLVLTLIVQLLMHYGANRKLIIDDDSTENGSASGISESAPSSNSSSLLEVISTGRISRLQENFSGSSRDDTSNSTADKLDMNDGLDTILTTSVGSILAPRNVGVPLKLEEIGNIMKIDPVDSTNTTKYINGAVIRYRKEIEDIAREKAIISSPSARISRQRKIRHRAIGPGENSGTDLFEISNTLKKIHKESTALTGIGIRSDTDDRKLVRVIPTKKRRARQMIPKMIGPGEGCLSETSPRKIPSSDDEFDIDDVLITKFKTINNAIYNRKEHAFADDDISILTGDSGNELKPDVVSAHWERVSKIGQKLGVGTANKEISDNLSSGDESDVFATRHFPFTNDSNLSAPTE
jgi:hypothetical protein